jgi:hypothetical protein
LGTGLSRDHMPIFVIVSTGSDILLSFRDKREGECQNERPRSKERKLPGETAGCPLAQTDKRELTEKGEGREVIEAKEKTWCARRDSNSRPIAPEAIALSS